MSGLAISYWLGVAIAAALLSTGTIRLVRAVQRRRTLELLRMYREEGIWQEAQRQARAGKLRAQDGQWGRAV